MLGSKKTVVKSDAIRDFVKVDMVVMLGRVNKSTTWEVLT
jgi:hypothetical protein